MKWKNYFLANLIYALIVSTTLMSCDPTVSDSDSTSDQNQIATVTDIDGNVYNTITIGNQVWMASNLKTTKFKDGSTIPLITDNTAWINLITPGYCWYNNDAATNKSVYGALYNWYSVSTVKLCPTGWHVPSTAEWATLSTYLGGDDAAGGKLKETGTTHWLNSNIGATNSTGFTAVPGGARAWVGQFDTMGFGCVFWSSSEVPGTVDAYVRTLSNNFANLAINGYKKMSGYSVRCLKD